MSRERFCKHCTGWHDLSEPWPVECRVQTVSKMSQNLAAPMIMCDTMDTHLQSMADGKHYDSKAAMRHSYKDNPQGIRYTEVGDDASVMTPSERKQVKPDRGDIQRSVQTAFSQAGLGAP